LIMRVSLFIVILALSFISVAQKAPIMSRVIYGTDDRTDTYELNSSDAALGASAAILVYGSNIVTENNDGTYTVTATSTAEEIQLFCPDERFSQQPIFSNAQSFCSAFLLSTNPPWVGTAAHCVGDDLSSGVLIFGFELIAESETRLTYAANDVYTISSAIVVGEATGKDGDYAILQLDREVTGHTPYTSINPSMSVSDNLVLIGHPSGLPKKTDKGGSVTAVTSTLIRGTTDSYGGNSGSPVFDSNGDLAGILVGGTTDFVYDYDDNCQNSNFCPGGVDCDEFGENIVPICNLIESSSTVQNQLNLDCTTAPASSSPSPAPASPTNTPNNGASTTPTRTPQHQNVSPDTSYTPLTFSDSSYSPFTLSQSSFTSIFSPSSFSSGSPNSSSSSASSLFVSALVAFALLFTL